MRFRRLFLCVSLNFFHAFLSRLLTDAVSEKKLKLHAANTGVRRNTTRCTELRVNSADGYRWKYTY